MLTFQWDVWDMPWARKPAYFSPKLLHARTKYKFDEHFVSSQKERRHANASFMARPRHFKCPAQPTIGLIHFLIHREIKVHEAHTSMFS